MTNLPPDVHPTESIPAFVLGALDVDDAVRVGVHIAACAKCRAEADSFSQTVSLMPYASGHLGGLRPHVKSRLFTRIATSAEVDVQQPAPKSPLPRRSWFHAGATAALAALAIVLAFFSAGLYNQRNALIAELTLRDQAVSELATRIAAQEREIAAIDEQLRAGEAVAARVVAQEREIAELRGALEANATMVSFIAAPDTVVQPLAATARAGDASAHMYMQPGHNRIVLLTHGLPALEPGKEYRLWLADDEEQVAVGTLTFHPDGTAELITSAPRPMDEYDAVMVTVDTESAQATPGDDIVFVITL
jgi:hypothetical protein